jgi:uncharacterized RDD family membrane protein YckC
MDEHRGIVTPEAVVLEFETAGVGSRLLPLLFDLFVQVAALGIVLFGLGSLASTIQLPETALIIVVLVVMFAIVVGYPIVTETLWDGRTIGKMIFGLRVVTKEGAPVRFRHSALRGILRIFEIIILLGGPAVISAIFTRDSQRLGDLVAGTIVIRERTGAGTAEVVTFTPPPGYEGYVASVDVSGLGAEQYGLVRSFLLRLPHLAPEARAVVAVRLANPVALRLSHTPPPMLNPEMFLVAVASAYQMRHGMIPPSSPWGAPRWQGPAPVAPLAPPVPSGAGPAPAPGWLPPAPPRPPGAGPQ